MGDLKAMADQIRAHESELVPHYEELARAAQTPAEIKIVHQLKSYQRLQLLSLELLGDRVPERFLGFGRVSADDVNIRSAPNGQSSLVGKVRQGDQVIICSYQGYWVEVQVMHGPSGYIFRDYVQEEGG
ncbi:MAG: SH3 domain-containing protein [Bacillota bacterium]|nr:SH3 domain-containing protein [Bacillota bacterium]